MFLNSEATVKESLTIKLNFAGDHTTATPPTTKTFDINPFYTYDITYVDKKRTIEGLQTARGRIVDVSYMIQRGSLFSSTSLPIIRNDHPKDNMRTFDPHGNLKPTTITVDCSTAYNCDVIDISIDNIRDIVLVENEIDLADFDIGDTVLINLVDGTELNQCIVCDIISHNGVDAICVSIIPESYYEAYNLNTRSGETVVLPPIETAIIRKQDIDSMAVLEYVELFPFKVRDSVMIQSLNEETLMMETVATGNIINIIDPTEKLTIETVVAIMLDDNTIHYLNDMTSISAYIAPDPEVPDDSETTDPDTPTGDGTDPEVPPTGEGTDDPIDSGDNTTTEDPDSTIEEEITP